MTLIIGLSALLIGLGLGYLIAKTTSNDAKRRKDLESQLALAQNELKQHREQVNNYFSTTSDLINKLTDSYKEVHEHLRMSAVQLCNDEISRHLLSITPPESSSSGLRESGATNFSEEFDTEIEMNLTPPKDYAPKSGLDKTGTLNEEYGLEKVDPKSPPKNHLNVE